MVFLLQNQHALSQPQSTSAPAAELVQLRIRQHQLECKNSLLEKLLHMKSRQKHQKAGWLVSPQPFCQSSTTSESPKAMQVQSFKQTQTCRLTECAHGVSCAGC